MAKTTITLEDATIKVAADAAQAKKLIREALQFIQGIRATQDPTIAHYEEALAKADQAAKLAISSPATLPLSNTYVAVFALKAGEIHIAERALKHAKQGPDDILGDAVVAMMEYDDAPTLEEAAGASASAGVSIFFRQATNEAIRETLNEIADEEDLERFVAELANEMGIEP